MIALLAKIKRMPRSSKISLSIMFIVIVAGGNWLGISALRIYTANLHELRSTLEPWAAGGRDDRVLVIAPHCDDETLGCAGIISYAVKQGAQVRVVVVTNGDGFYEVVRRMKRAGSKSYIDFGCRRQKESAAAMKLLGVKEEDVMFLGYPDRGTAAMWLNNWTPDNPFTSRYTRCSSSPYPNAYRRDAPYCGRALLADLESIILSFRPTTIYYPHPSDQHSDHWATHCFVTQALYELNMRHKVRTGLYIAHRGNWPIPQGLHPTMRLVPPAFMDSIGMGWYEYPLAQEHIALKLKAIRAYKSQLPFLGEYMYSFDRRNELFSSYGPTTLSLTHRSQDEDEEQIWERIPWCVSDPKGDSIRVDMGRSGDIQSLKCYFDDKNMYARIELAYTHSRRMNYGVQFCGIPDAISGRVIVTVTGSGHVNSEATVKRAGNTIDFTIPLRRLGKWDALMVCADSSIDKRKVDRTAWRVLIREGGEATSLPNLRSEDRRAVRMPISPARKPL